MLALGWPSEGCEQEPEMANAQQRSHCETVSGLHVLYTVLHSEKGHCDRTELILVASLQRGIASSEAHEHVLLAATEQADSQLSNLTESSGFDKGGMIGTQGQASPGSLWHGIWRIRHALPRCCLAYHHPSSVQQQ